MKNEPIADVMYQTHLYKRQMMSYSHDRWNSWGRWVAFCIILFVLFIVIIVLAFACITARRRRRAGLRPRYGTGWLLRNRSTSQQDDSNRKPSFTERNTPAPPHTGPVTDLLHPPVNDNTFEASHEFYGQKTTGQTDEMEQPKQSYQPPRG